jgi:spore coat protein U-like protein
MKKCIVLAFVALLPILALASRAEGAMTCTFNSVTGVAFGPYDVFTGSPTKGTGSIAYRCRSVGGVHFMTMSLSTGISGSFATRTLRSGANVLKYNLYPDAANSQPWGDGTGSTYLYQIDPVDQKVYSLTVYGTIPPGQDVATGNYTDSITITMNF